MENITLKKQGTWESIENIYRSHNHTVLEEILNEETGANFSLIYSDKHSCTYESKSGDLVILNSYGDINYSSIYLNPIFERISQQRLGKTNIMLNQFKH